MTKRPFTTKGFKAKECLKLVKINAFRLFNAYACGGYEYFITFINYYSRYVYVNFMHRKSNALDKFKEFKAKFEKKLGKNLKAPLFD